MKLKSLIIVFLSIALLGLADSAEAQKKSKYQKRRKNNKKVSRYRGSSRGPVGKFQPYSYAGASINAGNYFGEMAPATNAGSSDISFTRPGFGFYGGYQFHQYVAVRGGLNWVRVSGDDFSADPNSEEDYPRYARNLSFRNDIKELQLGVEVSLIPNTGGPNRRLPFNAYLFVGGAIYHHQPMGKVPGLNYQAEGPNATTAPPKAGEWVKLKPLGTEGQNLGITPSYSNIGFSIPVSIGAQMSLVGTPFNIGMEFGIRYLFTDYIDDVSGSYVDQSLFTDDLARIMADRSAEATNFQGKTRPVVDYARLTDNYYTFGDLGGGIDGTIRGNPDQNDLISMTQLKLTYVMGATKRRRAKYR